MKKIISLFIFFLKTVFLSPVNNPAFYCLLLTACLLYFGGNLEKLETVFLFITSAVSIRFISSLKAVPTDFSDSSESLLSRCTNLLPVKKKLFYICLYDFCCGVYFSAGFILLILWNQFPGASGHQINMSNRDDY